MWVSALLAACVADPAAEGVFEGVAVAKQEASAVALLDPTGEPITEFDLHESPDGRFDWMIHNVQLTPDGRRALATAMPPMDGAEMADVRDQLVVLDVVGDESPRWCPLDYGLAVAHVVTDGATAWLTAYDQDRVLVVDLESCAILDRWPLPPGTSPHGLRLAADGGAIWVAGMGDGSLHRVSLADGAVESWALPGPAVQVAVLPDGSAVLATVLDDPQLARLDLSTDTLSTLALPAEAVGPAQLYPTPDSAAVWVADQSTADGAVYGHEIYQVDARSGALLARVVVSEGPHGIVLSPDGQTVWVTTVGLDTVDRVDVAASAVVDSVAVGGGPNGISLGAAEGAMP